MPEDHEHLEHRIRERAFALWQEAGCPEGRAEEFWYLARAAENGGAFAPAPLPHTPIIDSTPKGSGAYLPAGDSGNFA